jgi:hypothetical protein
MWLFASVGPDKEYDNKGLTPDSIASTLENAIKAIKAETTFRVLTDYEDQARSLQRSMSSGMVFEASNFREELFKSYKQTLEIGGTFEDIVKGVDGFSKGMSKVVFMTSDMTKNGETFAGGLVALEKTTGIVSENLGGMASDFIRLEGSQIKSLERMQDIARVARTSGLNSQKLLEEVKGSISKIDSYGFKNGVDGLVKMSTQAQLLRTTVDEIGALGKAQDFMDPEKAIEAASKLQMLGGAIGNLGNPFKLMNMGMNDVEALQDEMIKMSANAFKINKETGEIDIDPLSRMRLKEQAEVFGKTLDQYTKIGREAKKAQEVMNAVSETGFGEGMKKESKDLLASLTEFKGGKMILDIPGFKTDDLESAMIKSPVELQKALETYQKTADMSDRDIAEKSLTLQDTLQKDARIIRDVLLLNLKPTDRQGIVNTLEKGIDIMGGAGSKKINEAAKLSIMGVNNLGKIIQKKSQDIEGGSTVPTVPTAPVVPTVPTAPTVPVPTVRDATLSSGKKLVTYGKNQMFNTIPEDEGAFAPKLLQKLDFLKNVYLGVQDFTSNLPTTFNPPKMETRKPTEMSTQQTITQKVETSGDINVNINVNTGGTLSDELMKDPKFLAQFKDRVVNTINNMPKISAEKGRKS